MLFCPNCANVVTVLPSMNTGANKWTCPTCPFEFPMDRQVTSQMHLTRKEVDDVMGGEESWKNVDSTEAVCPKCDNNRAYFMQLQIRSADEPMTTFYKPSTLSPLMRLALRVPSLMLMGRAIYALLQTMATDYHTQSAQWWLAYLRPLELGPPPAQPALAWNVFLAACIAQCTNVLISSIELVPPAEEPASFNLGSFAFILYLYSSRPEYEMGAHGGLLVALQLVELTALALSAVVRPPLVPRLLLTTAIASLRLLHFVSCPPADYPSVFQGHRVCEGIVLGIITCTIFLHSLAMLVTEGRVDIRPLVYAPSPVIRASDDFGLACIKLCTICLHATNLTSMSAEIALPQMPRKTVVELSSDGAQIIWGTERALPGLAHEVRSVHVTHERHLTDAGGIVRGIDKVRAGWTMVNVLAEAVAELCARPVRAVTRLVPVPGAVRGVPRAVRLVWHGTNGEIRRAQRIAMETQQAHDRALLIQQLRDPDMDMDGAALLADAGGESFRDIVQLHHARRDGPPLTRSEYRALVRASSAMSAETALELELLSAIRERRHFAPAAHENTRLCVVCCAEEREVICWPCRCIALCDGCREALVHHRRTTGAQLCPTCRTPIEAYSKLYLP
ncbi:hypothetical protein MCUN1_002360 [Malassezia cuniculi]|uniref:DNA-directed RNA polymerase III subunit RPC10 n=1 Tax=Malassezia cuniculi TaxID=948313 RepID=A0AAF0J7D4_9BASI|nr:hypothetical protein MCUN1_002360 [Malassezia cuniculi]